MSADSAARAWTLFSAAYIRVTGPTLPDRVPIEVIEKTPVLDLLERWYKEAGVEGASRVDFETVELLRANGRDV